MMGSMLRRGAISGDGATLSLDFTTGVLDPLLTFSRSSSGTYIGADGLVKTAGSNVARFDYDTSGTPLGLLIEGSATNLLAHTERLDEAQVSTEQYWITTYSVTGVTGATTGPDGVSNSATQFSPIAGNGTCIASAAMGTSAQRSFSFWAKRSSGSTNLEYTLDNGTNWVAVTTTSSWQRFTIAATTAAQRVGFRFAANNIYEVWGCQLQTGANSSSYIKNVSAAGGASRAADNCYLTDWSSFSPNWNTSSGSLLVEGDVTTVSRAAAFPRLVSFTNTTNANARFGVYMDTANNTYGSEAYLQTYSIQQAASISTTGSRFIHAISALRDAQSRLRGSLNGSTITTVSDAPNLGLATVGGFAINMGTNSACPSTRLRRIKYWPKELSQAELNSYTTI